MTDFKKYMNVVAFASNVLKDRYVANKNTILNLRGDVAKFNTLIDDLNVAISTIKYYPENIGKKTLFDIEKKRTQFKIVVENKVEEIEEIEVEQSDINKTLKNQTLSSEAICSICCTGKLDVSLLCPHCLCSNCAETFLKKGDPCPFCNEPFKRSDLKKLVI